MMENYNELEIEEMFNHVMSDIEKAEGDFEKTLSYKQLKYSEQQDAREIILTFGEWLFDYHLEEIASWSETSVRDILIAIFPHKISADISFFKKIVPVLSSFLEFAFYANLQKNGLKLIGVIKELEPLMLNEVEVSLKGSLEEKLYNLGKEMGLDLSSLDDLDKLYAFVDRFETPEKKSSKNNIIQLSVVKKQKNNA